MLIAILSYMEMHEMMHKMAKPGKVDWISVRPAKKSAVIPVDTVEASTEHGLTGDHYGGRSGKRQVTLIQAEHLKAIASILGVESVDPKLTRRNIVVSGINLISLKERKFSIGEAVLEGTGPCAPCSRMEENFGEGGYNAMRGHGGLCARVLTQGKISIGDDVHLLEE